MASKNIYALFQNSRQVILADTACRNASLPARIVPVPEQVSSECGMCLQIDPNDRPLLEQQLSGLHLTITYYEPE